METTEYRSPQSTRQNPLTFYLRTLLYMIMALVIRAVAFLPLGALLIFPEGSQWRWLALLCPLLLILVVLPLRFSFAQALVQPARERRFSFDKATSVAKYGSKLGESIVHALNIFKWGIPLWLMLGAAYYFYMKTDAISLMKGIGDLGAIVVTVLYAVANFFIGIAGGVALVPNGGIMEGLYTVAAVFGIGLLILLWGVMRNSAFRYIWALAVQNGQNPRAEARRRLTGRRGAQFWVAMVNLILWVPAAFVVFTTLKGMLSGLSETLFSYVATKELNMPELSNSIKPLIFAFAVCYLLLLPVRRILTAFFATKHLRHTYEEQQTAPVEEPAAEKQTADVAQTPEPIAPVFVPAQQAAEPEDEPEASEPAPEPAPVPAYTPYSEPAAAEPVKQAPVTEAEPVKPAEPAYQTYQTYQPYKPYQPEATVAQAAPAPTQEPAYNPYQPEATFTQAAPAPKQEPANNPYQPEATFAQATPAPTQEPAYTPYQPEAVAEEPATAAEPAPEQPETSAEEDDYIKPFAPQVFDTSDTAEPAAPADETETDL